MGDEVFLGPPELGVEGAQLVGGLGQPRVGQEVAQSLRNGNVLVSIKRMGAAFDQGPGQPWLPWRQQPLVAETDQPGGNGLGVGLEPQITPGRSLLQPRQ